MYVCTYSKTSMTRTSMARLPWLIRNRKEANDQESIQLSHTSHQRHQRERNTNANNWTLMETSLAESQTDSYFPTKWPNGYPKQKDVSDTHIQRRTIKKNKPWQKNRLGTVSEKYFTGGLNRFYVATILALTSAAV